MAIANSKKSSRKPEDIDLLKSDVASFASSLGLSTSLPSSGFNDVDFRKKATVKPNKPSKMQETAEKARHENMPKSKNRNSGKDSGAREKPKPRPSVLSLEDGDKGRGFKKFKNLPKLPLMKASALGVWYMDAAELEAKVIGEGKRVEIKNVEEWKSLAEKRREMGKRLMAQYAQDYESSRGQSGDIKMLISTQRSGTAVDKVSAFSVMVGDNPIANLRSLDALLGKLMPNSLRFLKLLVFLSFSCFFFPVLIG